MKYQTAATCKSPSTIWTSGSYLLCQHYLKTDFNSLENLAYFLNFFRSSSLCIFCGKKDESFTEDGLDLHYWKHCPMLRRCDECRQVEAFVLRFYGSQISCRAKPLGSAVDRWSRSPVSRSISWVNVTNAPSSSSASAAARPWSLTTYRATSRALLATVSPTAGSLFH